ncbi:tetratricopeptide repeat protein, partial [Balneolaceae bacterium YR4-1]
VDHRSDLFSLGILLYEMLTGRKPFQGEHQAAMTYSIVNEKPTPLKTYLPKAPSELVQILGRLLAKEPEDRIGSAKQVVALIKEVKESSDIFMEQTPREKTDRKDTQQDSGSDSTTFTVTVPNLGFGKKNVDKFGLLISATALIVLVLLTGWWFNGGNEVENNTEAPTDEGNSEVANHSIAVLPFEVTGSGADEWKDGMVTTLSLNLDGVAGLRAIPDRTILAKWKQKGQAIDIETQEALDIAREVGANYAILGSAVQLGNDLRFGVNVREVASGERLGQVEVRGAPDSVTMLTNNLTKEILGVLLERSEEAIPSVNLESITTESLPALKAFLAGERHFRSGEYEEAIADYESAIERDTSFALAYMRTSLSRGWLGSGNVDQPMKHAYQLSNQLPSRERQLVQARYMWIVKNNHMIAADSLRQMTKDYPDDPLVWYQFGEVLTHGPIAPGWHRAEEAFERAIELDPGQASHHHHYVEFAFALHNDSTLAAKRIKAHPGEDKYKEVYRLSLDLVFGNETQKENALSKLKYIDLPDYNNFVLIFNHPYQWELKERVLRVLQNREDIEDNAFDFQLAINSFQRGHLLQTIKELKQLNNGISNILAGTNSLGLPIPDSMASKYLEPKNLPDEPSFNQLESSIMYSIDQAKMENLDELFDKLQIMSDTTDIQNSSSDIGAVLKELQGYRAWKSGNMDKALRLWKDKEQWGIPGAIWRGDLYRELGKYEQAEDWYLTYWTNPISHERLGMLYEDMNKPEKAAEAYRRFIVAWKDADPELQDMVMEARQRLQKLSVSEKGATEEVIEVE